MPDNSRVEQVVRSAWERRLLVIAVERIAIAAAVVLGALVLMLLVGTQVLDWRWLLLLGAVGLGLAGYQIRQRLIGYYRVAQILDTRLQLADSLSTAWYLLTRPGQNQDPINEFQIKGAETVARHVDIASAFPFTGRRLWSIAGALALVAASLFSVRYFVTNSLSLQHSLIPMQLSEVFERNDKDSEETKRQRDEAKGADDPHSQKSAPKADGQKDGKDTQRAEQPPAVQGNTPSAGQQNPNQPAEMREAKEGQDDQSKQQRGEGAEGNAQQKSGEKQGEDGEKTAGSQKPSTADEANSPKSSNGLIDKMKEALSSLAAKMKPNSQGKQQQQSSEQKSGDPKSGDQQSGSKEQSNASQQASASQEASEQQQSAQGQQGQTQEQSKAGQGKSSDQSPNKSKSDSHSGIGSQDGDKATKDAEQLKALGKLAEIIGKRSESATGDVMVENPSGQQRLQTAYSQRQGQHSDLGGEINRDEVPLMYQQYVREYMTQVRRQAAKHHKPASPVSSEER